MISTNRFSSILKILIFLICIAFLSNLQDIQFDSQPVRGATTDTVCRFGITSPLGIDGYNIASLGVGSYLDWGAGANRSLPEGMEYIRVLRLRDDLYPQTLANLPSWLQANPDSVWVVGNEPDTTYEGQDSLLPEVYANRFYELATIIRTIDPPARIAFGSIVQPTPIRLRYLDRAWAELVAEAGGTAEASALIDIWSVHSFILNEQPGSWGTGIPPGFENDYDDAVIISNLDDTFSIDIFQSRLIDFRDWLAIKGEREKPLWITEYGSLLPPIDPPGGPDYYNVSDQDTANFMLATFDFMLSATDGLTGLPADDNKLVQRWFWYSMNGHRYTFGGTLLDPDNGKVPTLVGEEFIEYQSLDLAQPDLFPVSLTATPVSYTPDRTRVNYRLNLTIGNGITADTSAGALVWIYNGDPDAGGVLIAGPITMEVIQRCGGRGVELVEWLRVMPLTEFTLYVVVSPIGVVDSDPSNNRGQFSVFTDLPKVHFVPLILR